MGTPVGVSAYPLVLLLLLVGCSGGGSESVSAPAAPRTSLVVEVKADAAVAPSRLTLACDPPAGEHPDPQQACRDLAAVEDPFAPIPPGSTCTELYGGPQTATVRGTYRGRPVDVAMSRTDGCEVAQWDAVGALLPPVIGAR